MVQRSTSIRLLGALLGKMHEKLRIRLACVLTKMRNMFNALTGFYTVNDVMRYADSGCIMGRLYLQINLFVFPYNDVDILWNSFVWSFHKILEIWAQLTIVVKQELH